MLKKIVSIVLVGFFCFSNSIVGYASPISDPVISREALSSDFDVIAVIPLEQTEIDANLSSDIDISPGINLKRRSIPKKVEKTSTSYFVDKGTVIARSPIVQKGMTASVSYTKSLSASFSCNVSVGKEKITAGVGFNVSGQFSTSGSASMKAKRRGHLVLVPQYQVVKFKVLMKSRRPINKKKNPWVHIGNGTAKKPVALVALWIND